MSDQAERTEKATPERRKKARADGQFARAKDGAQVAAALCVLGVVITGAPTVYDAMRNLLRASFSLEGGVAPLAQHAFGVAALCAVAPALAAASAATAVGFAQAGMRPDFTLAMPKFSRFQPLQALKRLVSLRSAVMETGLTLARVSVVATVTVLTVKQSMPVLVSLSHAEISAAAAVALGVAANVAKKSGAALLVLSLVDYAKSRWEMERNLRMSKQEIKEEHKRNEGDGRVKHRMIARGRERIKRAVKKQVAMADVVLANPTHVSVALRYRAKEGAPIVLAKGYDDVALFIRKCAREAGVPIVEAPPLARALAKRVKVGRVVPRDLWSPVAEVLAFVYRLKRNATARGSHSLDA